ncbi:MAG TPA: DUF2461 domain-containing protein [Polyangiaceae bacterium]|nr:DUF2461 domain-containing protein [Polyangiaceae bacterium]
MPIDDLPAPGRQGKNLGVFSGIPKGTLKFLSELSRNNEKAWFEEHRADYESYFMEPAKALVAALAAPLKKLDPNIHAEPRVNGSILRINRDVRFSKDKTPYKDHLDLWFWSGSKKGWDNSGFFFRLSDKKLLLGAGMHGFVPPVLALYREQVLSDKRGPELSKVAAALNKKGYQLGGETYKKPPKGVPAEHPRAALLKHGGLYSSWDGKHPKELGTARFVDFVVERYRELLPLHRWLSQMTK